jgi:apolipoprotein N-acyltransferase
MLLGGAGLLTAAFAPADQFYLAWVGLVPWLIVLSRARSIWAAFGWSWVAGTLFFIANMWWMSAVTVPGMIGLMAILGMYWGYAGVVLYGAGVVGIRRGAGGNRGSGDEQKPDPDSSFPSAPLPLRSSSTVRVLLTAVVWTAAAEWFRGTWPWHGLPWLYLGYTQSPVLALCQSADLFGVAGISFLIAAANAWIALWVLNRLSLRGLVPSGLIVLTVFAANLGYGIYRVRTEPKRWTAGPVVMVVQPNYPQDNSGQKGAKPEDIVDDHMRMTMGTLGSNAGAIDLVVWSETMMPPFNRDARQHLAGTRFGAFAQQTFDDVRNLAYTYRVGVLTGGEYIGRVADGADGYLKLLDKSNVVYAFDRHGAMDDQIYRKIHLVPFGEFIPFKEGCPPLYRLAVKLGPPDMDQYELVAGDEDQLTVFTLKHDPQGSTPDAPPWRYVTPICFEDIDADICARMLRPDGGTSRKRADFLVNVTNDGWFMANENSQHLQAAVFRSIENRVPTARAVNTGISGFIDPIGRQAGLVTARTAGTSVRQLPLDGRVTLFTRTGQLFARLCAGGTLLVIGASLGGWAVRRSRRTAVQPTLDPV